jgi:hypothetical protein
MNESPGRGGQEYNQRDSDKKDDWDWGKDDHVKGVRDDDENDDHGRRTQ